MLHTIVKAFEIVGAVLLICVIFSCCFAVFVIVLFETQDRIRKRRAQRDLAEQIERYSNDENQ